MQGGPYNSMATIALLWQRGRETIGTVPFIILFYRCRLGGPYYSKDMKGAASKGPTGRLL